MSAVLLGAYKKFVSGKINQNLVGIYQDIIDFNTNGDNTIATPPDSGRKLRLHLIMFLVGGVTNIRFKSGATSKTGLMPFAANQGIILSGDEIQLEMVAGDSFIINSSNAVQIGGLINFSYE